MANANDRNNHVRPVHSREDLAKAQQRINSEKDASRKQHDADLVRLDRAFEKQANKPTSAS
jgi:hypothetical protein